MAKHRQENRLASSATQTTQKRRRSPSVLLLSIIAAVVSTVLVFGHATNNTADSPQVQLAASTIGIGGRGDPTAARIPAKLQGNVVTHKYIPVNYPASFFIDSSVAAGVPVLDKAIKDNVVQSCDGTNNPCPFLLVVGYSEGTIVAEKVRRDLVPGVDGAPPADQLRFVMIASPHVPNGGIFARFPNVSIPFFVTSNGAAQPSPYGTTYVTNEYDPYADFPAYFNPLSILNSLFAIAYVHPDQYYDSVDYNPQTGEHGPGVLVKTVTNSAGGTDRYVFVRATHLPLLAPVRANLRRPRPDAVHRAAAKCRRAGAATDRGYGLHRSRESESGTSRHVLVDHTARENHRDHRQGSGCARTRGEQLRHRRRVDPRAGHSHDCADEFTLDRREVAASGAARVASEQRAARGASEQRAA